MRTVFVISPNYLEALYHESKDFKFGLQGYGSFAAACNGIMRLNPLDAVGFAYVGDDYPSLDSKEGAAMLQLFGILNDYPDRKKFLFVVRGSGKIAQALARKFPGVLVSYISEVESFTDILFKRDVFGSLLMAEGTPYVFKRSEEAPLGKFVSPTMKFKPLISSRVLECLAEVQCLTSIEMTMEHDSILREYKRTNDSILQLLREYKITKECGGVFDRKNHLETLIAETTDETMWCNYNALLTAIEEGSND